MPASSPAPSPWFVAVSSRSGSPWNPPWAEMWASWAMLRAYVAISSTLKRPPTLMPPPPAPLKLPCSGKSLGPLQSVAIPMMAAGVNMDVTSLDTNGAIVSQSLCCSSIVQTAYPSSSALPFPPRIRICHNSRKKKTGRGGSVLRCQPISAPLTQDRSPVPNKPPNVGSHGHVGCLSVRHCASHFHHPAPTRTLYIVI